MSIAKAVVKRPVLWLVVFSLVAISGIFLLSGIAIDMFPEIELPMLVIITAYPGADPETVENSVTRVLEAAVATTSGIQEMTSISSAQNSLILLRFDFGTDMDVKINRVRENIDRVRSALPDNVRSPMLIQFNPDDMPIMQIAVRGAPGSDLTQNDLRAIATNQLEDQFRQVEGVASTSVAGGLDPIIRVSLSQNRLEAYGITISEVSRSLAMQNMALGAGFIEEGLLEYYIRTSGEYASLEEIANSVVLQIGSPSVGGHADIRLQDIGEVYFDFQDERSSVYINGEPGVYISIMKQSGANTVDVANQVYRRLDNLRQTLPQNISLETSRDSTIQTRAMVDELISSIIVGIILAMLVLFLFFRSINSSIIVGLAIPFSFVITLLVMSLANITVNMMTLAGLILGMGMTVDCAIVVIESIIKYREKGEKRILAAILAGEEVMSTLIVATTTTLCVFVPIILFKNQLGFVGIMLQDMILTIAISVAASLFVGIFLVPVLASKWLPVHSRLQKPLRSPIVKRIDSSIADGIAGFTNGYKWLLSKALKHRFITVLLVICAFIGSVLALGRMDITMMPNMVSDTVTVNIEMPLGTRYDETKTLALEIQEFVIAQINGAKNISTNIGSGGGGMGGMFGGSSANAAAITIVLDLDDPNVDSEDMVKQKLRSHFINFPNASFSFTSSGAGAMMGGSDIDITLRINDLREGLATAETIKNLLEINVPEIQDIAISMEEGLPQITVNIDRARAYNMGLNVTSISSEIAAAMNGVTATTFRQSGDEYSVVLQLAKEDRQELPDLGRIFVRSSRGMLFPVSNFASFERTLAPVSINRENQMRIIRITADVIDGFSVRDVEAKIQRLLHEEGIQAIFGGTMQDAREMIQTFIQVIILALLLVFGIMAAQYESFRAPIINFCTIPLLLIGVVLIHIITGQPISAFTMIGIVLLVGLVTNNGILLVDYTNQLVKGTCGASTAGARGMNVNEACLEAGANRFRPVLMTALTTMLALTPMAFFPGNSAGMTAPIGLVVFGGLTSATVITLIFIPVLYSLFHSKRKEKKDED
jgi:HAE1 family hydrophobic/amphiphilic exporter-1